MSTRRSRPPRSRKSRSPEAPPAEVVVIVPPAGRTPHDGTLQPLAEVRADTPEGELAAIEAGWDELLA